MLKKMLEEKFMVILVAMIVLVSAGMAMADIVTFQNGLNGYTDTHDAQMLSYYGDGSFETNSSGGGTTISVGTSSPDPQNQLRTILKFDGLSVMAGSYASIDSVTVQLRKRTEYAFPILTVDVLDISNANAGWVEGVNGVNVAGAPSWLYMNNPTTWVGGAGLAGGTDGIVSSFSVDPSDPFGTAYTFTLPTSLIEDWITGINAGLLLNTLNASSFIQFGSSEYLQSYRPALTINYTPIPEPATMALLSLGGLLLVRKKRQ